MFVLHSSVAPADSLCCCFRGEQNHFAWMNILVNHMTFEPQNQISWSGRKLTSHSNVMLDKQSLLSQVWCPVSPVRFHFFICNTNVTSSVFLCFSLTFYLFAHKNKTEAVVKVMHFILCNTTCNNILYLQFYKFSISINFYQSYYDLIKRTRNTDVKVTFRSTSS